MVDDLLSAGYGFLAENAELAAAAETSSIKFIGPSKRVLALMGDKIAARSVMAKAEVQIVPGTEKCIAGADEALIIGKEIGYPVIIKPSGGGGGIGMTYCTASSNVTL